MFYAKWRLTKRQRVEALREMVANLSFPPYLLTNDAISEQCHLKYRGRKSIMSIQWTCRAITSIMSDSCIVFT